MEQNFRSMNKSGRVDDGIQKQIGDYEKSFLNWLVNMHNTLRKDQIQLEEVKHLSEVLLHMKEESSSDYLDSLIKPEMTKGSKIPTSIPVPSSSFQLHNSMTFAPNALGHAAIVFNPFFLSSNTALPALSTLYINNNAALTGNAASNFFIPTNIGQTIPLVYNEYRLVSASIVIRYIGRLDIVQGVIGGAIVFDNAVDARDSVVAAANPDLAKYGNFNLAQDSYYFQENMTLNGLREIYFPLDNVFEQYRRMGAAENDSKTGFAFVIYLQDGVSLGTTQNYKIDIYCNYECLPDATFLNYIPTTPSASSAAENKEHAIRFAQLNPITDGTIPRAKTEKPSFWESIKSTLGSILPSIASLGASFIPGGKIVGPALQAMSGLFGSTGGNNSNAPSFMRPQLGSRNDYENMVD